VQTFVGSAGVARALHGGCESCEATYAADAFAVALAEPSSRFQKALVESGACVSARASAGTRSATSGPITVRVQAAPPARSRSACARPSPSWMSIARARLRHRGRAREGRVHPRQVDQIKEREKPELLRARHHVLVGVGGARLLRELRRQREEGEARGRRPGSCTTYVTGKPFRLRGAGVARDEQGRDERLGSRSWRIAG
jgi:hypothetical protein